MKRILSLFLIFVMAVVLTSCAGRKDSDPADDAPYKSPAPPVADASEPAPDSAEPHEPADSSTDETGTEAPSPGGSVLVVFFSATGTTRGVAEKIAALTDADLAEIVPVQPYTSEDLDYSDRTTRASAEQNDPAARPQLVGDISLNGYSTIYLGYPIWWGQAPRILSSFVEGHDFTGMTVIPFCTSGSSDIGQSDDTLAAQACSGTWLQGRRFPGDVSEDLLMEWINETTYAYMEDTMHLYINGQEASVEWERNESVDALTALVSSGPLSVKMSPYGGFEQVGPLEASLPRNDAQTTTQAGDIVLYSGNQLVVFYGSNSWAYTRLGRITGKSAAELTELLGTGDVTITLALGITG